MAFSKRLIFCMTPGRTGTMYLAHMLKTVPGVYADHEPDPNFVDVMRVAIRYPGIALWFWKEKKLPFIETVEQPVYAETSHLFTQGFAGPLLDMGIVPDIIVLRRNIREIALSRYSKGSIPGRSRMGLLYLLHPSDPVIVRVKDWQTLTDYQLCYWFTIEMEARISNRVVRAKVMGSTVVETTMNEVVTTDGFCKMVSDLNLPQPHVEYLDIYKTRINANDVALVPENIDQQEADLIGRLEWTS